MRYSTLLVATAFLSGCATPQLDPLPAVKSPGAAATVTVERPVDLVGAPATMFVIIEDRRVYALKNGGSWSFKIDPGMYRFGYDQGFNMCRKRLEVAPNKRYLVKFTPVCRFKPQIL
jgi:hypothetical protein